VVVLNLTPVSHELYRIGAPAPGTYRLLLDSGSDRYDGGRPSVSDQLKTESEPMHGFPQSLALTLPGLTALVYAYNPAA
jgi:1,4-alpha-glucan branching enzyme